MSASNRHRGVDCPGAKFYRVRTFDAVVYVTNKRDVRAAVARADACGDRATIHRVTLTALLTPKALALALLNGDERAFFEIKPIDYHTEIKRYA